MIWMQDVAYTDYIYWQETNSFINGLASSSQNIELFFDKKVDRDSSLVIYDGKQVDLSHDHIYIDVQKEGVTQLVYILKDVDGYALEQGEKSILLDTTIPDVVVKVKDHNVMDVLPLENKETIHVEILFAIHLLTEHVFFTTENTVGSASKQPVFADRNVSARSLGNNHHTASLSEGRHLANNRLVAARIVAEHEGETVLDTANQQRAAPVLSDPTAANRVITHLCA